MGPRRLSEAISEGEGISLLVAVSDAAAAAEAERAGADGLVVADDASAVAPAPSLPVLLRGDRWEQSVDAVVLVVARLDVDDGELERQYARARDAGLEPVVEVRDEDELESALESVDPEIFLLSGEDAEGDEEPIDRVLSLLADVPAGKLAIADVAVAARDEVLALERAGMDAVVVDGALVGELAGGAAPSV